MTLTTAQQNQLRQPVYGAAVLCELHFADGIQRYTSWGHDLRIGGQDWVAVPPKVISISTVQEAEALEYPAMDIGLAIPDPDMLELLRGSEKTYRGRLMRLYLVVMDDALRVVDEPQLLHVAVMDQLQVNTGNGADDQGSLSMRCEQPGKDSRNAMSQRLTAQQHVRKHPGDTGLARLAEIAGGPQTWLTRRFQQR
ncbi:hypothetical protein D8I35_09410 [Corticibacter populi]|uniref:DUF2163 domain-containing protein n=1 Tax=Corticibacter populi TaxID=1550736 RepID=A0A3M6QUK8_9BURK|nr:hypothetical protein [Corticibacter populi]RMX06708.1 hypothetical protein D8I35_09410 [Corticibacter populi]RZS31711.1 hypothetical protein EV687_2380 [Corticibacter populi]